MKKALVIVSIAAVILIIAAGVGGFFFGRNTVEPDEVLDPGRFSVIYAEILEVRGTHFHVKNLDGSGEYTFNAQDDTRLSYRGSEIGAEDFSDGDTIHIYCLNYVLYTSPMQIPEVYELILIERAEEGA